MEPRAPRPLTLCHFTAVEVEPPEFVDLAARAGFAAVSLMIQFPRAYSPGFPMAGDTRMRRETRQRLDATGVTLFDAATARLEPDSRLDDFRALVETAAYLGARGIDVNGNDPDPARLTDQFAALCALCAEHGLGVGIEFMMSTRVRALIDAVGPDVMLGVEAPSRRRAEQGVPAAAYAVQAMEALRRLLDGPGGRAVAGS